MTFIALIIVLSIDYFTTSGHKLRSSAWLNVSLEKCYALLEKYSFFKGGAALVALLAIFGVATALIYWVLLSIVFGLLAFIFSIFILLFCLQGFDFQRADTIDDILKQSVSYLFSTVFWFLLLGPFGAIIYRINHLIIQNDFEESLTSSALFLEKILDWLPVRLLTFCFALAGHFSAVIGVWLDNVFSDLNKNDEILLSCAKHALAKETEDKVNDLDEKSQYIVRLLQRSLIIWLIVIALLVLF